jgi:hypothetical protein
MPNMQAMIERLNARFNREAIDQLDAELVAPGTTLAVAARKIGAAQTSAEREYIASWPAGQQEAVRAALYSALTRSPRLPVTMAWTPGYDFEVRISEAAGTRASRGAMTITFSSRYPGDPILALQRRGLRR